jgi:hypothetical protein
MCRAASQFPRGEPIFNQMELSVLSFTKKKNSENFSHKLLIRSNFARTSTLRQNKVQISKLVPEVPFFQRFFVRDFQMWASSQRL